MLESLLDRIHRRRKIALAVGLALLAGFGSFAWFVSLDDSPERWLPASSIEAWERFAEHYDYSDTIAVALAFERPVRDQDIDLLRTLREEFARLPGVARVTDASLIADAIERVPLTVLIGGPEPGSADPYAMYRGILFDNPAEWSVTAGSFKGRTLLSFIEIRQETAGAADHQEELNRRRRGVVAGVYSALERHPLEGVAYHVTGGVVIQYELEMIARRLAVTILPLALILTVGAVGLGFWSLWAVAFAVLGGAWSIAVLLGAVALAGWSLNVVTCTGPTLMAVLIITTAVHFSHFYSRSSGEDGGRASASPERFIRWVAVPCFGAALITATGFLMNVFNQLTPSRELGIQLFAGIMLGFLGSYLVWLFAHPIRTAGGRLLSPARLEGLQRAAIVWPVGTVAVLAVILLASAWAARWVRVDADPFSFFHRDSRVARALEHVASRNFGLYILEVVFVPRERGGLIAAEDLGRIRAFEAKIRQRPEVRNVISSLGVLERQNLLRLSFTDVRRALAFSETFANWTRDRAGQGALRISFMLSDAGEGFRPIIDAVRSSLPTERFECFYTGAAANVVVLFENLVGGLARGLGVAGAIMPILCLILFRSVRLTLAAFPPNALPVLVLFGLMGTFGIPLNSGSAMVSTIALGIAVNETVLIVMNYQRRRLDGADTDTALVGTFREIGRPVLMTAAVNSLGFAIFTLSDFKPLYDFGLLASLTFAAALVGDLVLLPNLIKLLDRSPVGCEAPVRPAAVCCECEPGSDGP